jgi:hypothetical protein
VREQNYLRILDREGANQEQALILVVGSGHVENMRPSFASDDRVIVLMPTRLGEERPDLRDYRS